MAEKNGNSSVTTDTEKQWQADETLPQSVLPFAFSSSSQRDTVGSRTDSGRQLQICQPDEKAATTLPSPFPRNTPPPQTQRAPHHSDSRSERSQQRDNNNGNFPPLTTNQAPCYPQAPVTSCGAKHETLGRCPAAA